jgi:hypothetical protein
MPSQLDLSNPITFKDKATAYFEDIIFQLFQATNPAPVQVTITGGIATVDLSKGRQFNIEGTVNFAIDVIGVTERVSNFNMIDIQNPAGAYELTNITVPAGVTALKSAGSTISILGNTDFAFQVLVPSDDRLQVIPFEMEPL